MHQILHRSAFAHIQRLAMVMMAIGFFAPAARGDVLFDSGITAAVVDDLGYNDEAVAQRVFEDISFTKDVQVTAIDFVGGYFPANSPQADSFHLVFLNDISGLPDRNAPVADVVLAAVSRTASGFSYATTTLYDYSATFPGVAFEAGKTYWLAVRNNTSNDPDDDWVWGGLHNSGAVALAGPPDDQFFLVPGGFAFTLHGDVIPEPNAVACVTPAVIAVGMIGRFQRYVVRCRRRMPARPAVTAIPASEPGSGR